MHTIDDFEKMLVEIADEIPEIFLKDLNGGIILDENCKFNSQGADDLCILSEHNHDSDMGCQIIIYYGSFMHMYENEPEEVLRAKLRKALQKELACHLESLADAPEFDIKNRILL